MAFLLSSTMLNLFCHLLKAIFHNISFKYHQKICQVYLIIFQHHAYKGHMAWYLERCKCLKLIHKTFKWHSQKDIWFFPKNSQYTWNQKQLSLAALRKRCSENMQQIYRRTPMPKCDFNKVALQLCWNCILAWVFTCKLAAYFLNTFLYEHLCRTTFSEF